MSGPWEQYQTPAAAPAQASGPWTQYAQAAAPSAPPAPKPEAGTNSLWGTIRAAARGAADTASFGFGDELGAAAQALLPMGGSHSAYTDGFRKAYDANVAAIHNNAASDDANHPVARTVGQVAGAIPAAVTMGGGAGMLGRLAVNGAQGAVYGLGSGSGGMADRATSAGKGGLFGAAGGELGNVAVKAASRVLSPVVNPLVQHMLDMGVNLSPGQRAGGGFNTAEGALARVPLIGELANKARNDSLTSANTAVMNDSLQHIGAQLPAGTTGNAAHAYGQQAFSDAYDAVNPALSFVPDAAHAANVDDLLTRATTPGVDSLTPAYAAKLKGAANDDMTRRVDPTTGAMTGQAYADYVSKMKKSITSYTGTGNGDQDAYASSLQDLLDHVETNARAYSPPEAIDAKDGVDKGYALWARLEDAAKRRGGPNGEWTPAQYDAAVQKGDSRVRSKGYLAGNALGQVNSNAITDVLPDGIKGSDTILKGLFTGGVGAASVGAAHFLSPTTLIPAAAAQLPYLPGIRQAGNYLTSGTRAPWARNAGGLLSQYAAPAGSALGLLSASKATGN